MRPALALAALVAGGALLVVGLTRGDSPSAVEIERFSIDSRLVGRTVDEIVLRPPRGSRGRPLLVLLHGRGASPDMFLYPELLEGLEKLGSRAPAVLLASGGDSSYFHDRREGAWASHLLREAIPQAAKRLAADSRRVAIGGISMGGWGALALAQRLPSRFCAVGGHSAAMWFTGAETPDGAFDDAEDFERHDLIEAARDGRTLGRTRVWIDVGRADPFADADTALARALAASGQPVSFRLWPGGHEMAYWRAHTAAYLRFYADALAACDAR